MDFFYFESQNAAIRAAWPGLNVLVFVKGSGRAIIVAIWNQNFTGGKILSNEW